MKTALAAAVVGSSLLFSAAVSAEEKLNGVTMQGRISSSDNSDSVMIMGGFSRLISPSVALDLLVLINETSSAGSDSTMTFYTGQGKYYFAPVGQVGEMAPYAFLGLTLGTIEGGGSSSDLSGFSYGVGAEYFVREAVSVPVELRMSSLEADGGGSSDQTELSIGIKVYF